MDDEKEDLMNASEPTADVVASTVRHRAYVQQALLAIRHELERRALEHDLSKFDPAGELPGFARINATARRHAYGSVQYKASLKAEQPTVDRHYRGNSHHPEHHGDLSEMGPFDLIEMVCDWWGATKGYGGRTPWAEVLEKQRQRFDFTEEQWWLVNAVATFLEGNLGGP
jgi:hypothetical protein